MKNHKTCIIGILVVLLSGGIFLVAKEKFDFGNKNIKSDTDEQMSGYREVVLDSDDGLISIDYKDVKAKIIAEDKKGRKTESYIAYGFDEIIKDDYSTGGYFVISTNRENERIIGFDKVSLVEFTSNGPTIIDVIPGSGFGEYYRAQWFYIPQKDRGDVVLAEDLTLYVLDARGESVSEWAFGEDLVLKPEWQEGFGIMGTEILDSGQMVLNIIGSCDIEEKFPLCAQFVLDIEQKQIKSIK